MKYDTDVDTTGGGNPESCSAEPTLLAKTAARSFRGSSFSLYMTFMMSGSVVDSLIISEAIGNGGEIKVWEKIVVLISTQLK